MKKHKISRCILTLIIGIKIIIFIPVDRPQCVASYYGSMQTTTGYSDPIDG